MNRGEGFEDIISSFHGLRKFEYHGGPEDDESYLNIRALLDVNESTLKHLILDDCDVSETSLDSVFESVTINNLTHLDLSYTMDISGSVLGRISKAENLQSLTLCGSFEPEYASQLFVAHRFPHLESFTFTMVDVDEEMYYSVVSFLKKREKLRRLDLGNCPWDIILEVLPTLRNLRVLAVNFNELSQEEIEDFVKALPTQMVAIEISADSQIPLVCIFSFLSCSQVTHSLIRTNVLPISLAFTHCPSCTSDSPRTQ